MKIVLTQYAMQANNIASYYRRGTHDTQEISKAYKQEISKAYRKTHKKLVRQRIHIYIRKRQGT